MQRVTPQLGQRRALQIDCFVLVERPGQLGLAAGHQHHVFGFLLQTKSDGVVGGGVASVQGRHHVDLRGQLAALGRFGHAHVQKAHAVKTQLLGQRLGRCHQLTAGLNAINRALAQRFEKQVVNDETQIRLACTVVGERGAAFAGGQLQQQLFDELEQVVDLLELAARILIELALAGQDVELLEQLDRLAGAHFGRQLRSSVVGGRLLFHGRGPTSNFFQPSAPSFSRVSMLVS